MRRIAKPVKHGVNYREGKATLRDSLLKDNIDISEKECGRMIEHMRAARPMMVNWQNETEHEIRSKRLLTTPLGRQRRFTGKLSDDVIREGIAWVPACTLAHVLNIGIDRVYKWIEEQENPNILDLLMNHHDAMQWQSPIALIHEHAKLIGQFMQVSMTIHGRELIIPSDLTIGKSWGEMKEAEE